MTEVSFFPQPHVNLGGKRTAAVLGYSTRALAEACRDAGIKVHSVDHFGDADLRSSASSFHVVDPWPDYASCLQGLERLPNGAPILLAGGTESLAEPIYSGTSAQGISSWSNFEKTSSQQDSLEASRRQNSGQQATNHQTFGQQAAAASSELLPPTAGRTLSTQNFLQHSPQSLPSASGTELDDLHRQFSVFGPTAAQMRRLRDPNFWKAAARESDLCFPPTVLAGSPPVSTDARWLRKSRSGGGGLHVRRAPSTVPQQNHSATATQRCEQEYWQQEIVGRSIGVTCILLPGPKGSLRVCLLGATEAWTARDWPGPTEFIYRGSWGPIKLSPRQCTAIKRFAAFVGTETGLFGWLQMDFIESADRKLWLLEINPRWTAGMEVLARTGYNPVPLHLAAYETALHSNAPKIDELASEVREPSVEPDIVFAKAIVYAKRDFELTEDACRCLRELSPAHHADIPYFDKDTPPTAIPEGSPLLTVHDKIASANVGDARQSLLERLRNHAVALEECVGMEDCLAIPNDNTGPGVA